MEKENAEKYWNALYTKINGFCIKHDIQCVVDFTSKDLKTSDFYFDKKGCTKYCVHLVFTSSSVIETEISECSKAIIEDLKKHFNIGGTDMDARIRDNILEKAKEIINGERQGQYGKPENSFQRIAELWSTYLGRELSDYDVANMMILMKVARNAGGVYKDDNWIDICGYAAIGAELQAASREG